MRISYDGLTLPTCSICNDAKMLLGAICLFGISLAYTEAPLLNSPTTMVSEEAYQSR